MEVNCLIIGEKGSGKTTLFNCFAAKTPNFNNQSNLLNYKVEDYRIKEIAKIQPSKKISYTSINIKDSLPLEYNERWSKLSVEIKNSDLLIYVVNCFNKDSSEAIKQLENLELEFLTRDYKSAESKLTKLEKVYKIGNKQLKQDIDNLTYILNKLKDFIPVRKLKLNESILNSIADLSLFSQKKILFFLNTLQNQIDDNVRRVEEYLSKKREDYVTGSALIEFELMLLNKEEMKDFMSLYQINEFIVEKIIKKIYLLLDLVTFYTVNQNEIKAWIIKKETPIIKAAGKIHSDFEKGFIRAEVIKYEDFVRFKGENACKLNGKYLLVGKDYLVNDGDIVYIRFNLKK